MYFRFKKEKKSNIGMFVIKRDLSLWGHTLVHLFLQTYQTPRGQCQHADTLELSYSYWWSMGLSHPNTDLLLVQPLFTVVAEAI